MWIVRRDDVCEAARLLLGGKHVLRRGIGGRVVEVDLSIGVFPHQNAISLSLILCRCFNIHQYLITFQIIHLCLEVQDRDF